MTINTDQAHSFSVFEALNIKLQQITPFLGGRAQTQILGKCIWCRSYFFDCFVREHGGAREGEALQM